MAKITQILKETYTILDKQYPKDIHFLEKREPFQFLITVILSAQTTDEIANKVSSKLFEKYPTAQALAIANIEDIKTIIYSTGFYNSKAQHITDCAKVICEKHDGVVPTSMEELTSLPGVGRKTANCLRSNILGLPGIIVDTHFSRVISRLLALKSREPVVVEKIISEKLPQEMWSRFSMTVNAHGRNICHSQKPQCENCPLTHLCLFYKAK